MGNNNRAALHVGKPPRSCPDCSKKGMTYDSRQRDEYFWRRHRCGNGHTWVSIEVLVERQKGTRLDVTAIVALRRAVMLDMIEKLKEGLPECSAIK